MTSIEKECFRLFQEVVLERDQACQMCGYPATAAHHIFGRTRRATAFDPENGVGLCKEHHRRAHLSSVEFLEWVRDVLIGSKRFYLLREKSLSVARFRDADFKAIKKGLQETLEALRRGDDPTS